VNVETTVLDPLKTISLSPMFTSDFLNNPSCYSFTYYQNDSVTTPIVPPFPMDLNYPSLTIPQIAAGTIGFVPSIMYINRIKATVVAQSISVLSSLIQIVFHECTAAELLPFDATLTLQYTLLSGA
jgi:hypothetical protein